MPGLMPREDCVWLMLNWGRLPRCPHSNYSLPSSVSTSENWHPVVGTYILLALHSAASPAAALWKLHTFALRYWVEIMDLCGEIPKKLKSSLFFQQT